jgi:hypothetical protein
VNEGYSVPRLAGLPAPALPLYDAGLAVRSLTGTTQLDHRTMPSKGGTQAGFVPTVTAHVLHVDPATGAPLGREQNGLLKKGVQGHLLACADAGLAFLAADATKVCLASAIATDDDDATARVGTVLESFSVWEKFTPPTTLADAVPAGAPESMVVPFVDVVSVSAVPPSESPGRVPGGARSCLCFVTEDEAGRRRSVVLLAADAGWDPGLVLVQRMLSELRALQRRLKDEVTAGVRAGYGPAPAGDELEEMQSEVEDTWLLWRRGEGMGDAGPWGYSRVELERYFADLSAVMPAYWEVPAVRDLLERECRGIHGALPTPGMAPTPPPPAPTPPPPAPAPKPPATGLNELPPPAIAGLILVFGAVVGLITGGIVSFGEQRNWDLSASDRQLQDFLGGDSSPSAVYGIQHLIYLAANVVRALALLVVVGALVGVVVTGSRWLRKRNAG